MAKTLASKRVKQVSGESDPFARQVFVLEVREGEEDDGRVLFCEKFYGDTGATPWCELALLIWCAQRPEIEVVEPFIPAELV